MDSLSSQLQDDGLLMMYVAGELPDSDREALERRLASDGGLRDQLNSVRVAMEMAESGLAQLDAASPVRTDAAIRRASKAIRTWQCRPAPARISGADASSPGRMRFWIVPAAAAAIVLIVAGISFYQTTHPDNRVAVVNFPTPSPVAAGPVTPSPTPSTAPSDDDARLAENLELFRPAMDLDTSEDVADHDSTVARHEESVALDDSGDVFNNIPLPAK